MTVLLRFNNTDDSAARHVGWSPVPFTARLAARANEPLPVEVRNLDTTSGGQLVFKDPATGDWTHGFRTRLPADGSPVEFEIAGRFRRPSVVAGDAIIAVVPAAPGLEPGTLAVTVRIRKDANGLSAAERDLFLAALAEFNDAGRGEFAAFRDVHVKLSSGEMHEGQAFLPWHRAFLLDIERELQRIHPAVTVPYWRFEEPAPNVFSTAFIGAHDQPGPVRFAPTNPLLGWVTEGLPGVTRSPLKHMAINQKANVINAVHTVATQTGFTSFRSLERLVHAPVHFSFTGFIRDHAQAIRDPLFLLLHASIDRMWAEWQYLNDKWDATDPMAYDTSAARIGHGIDDTMWPWNQVRDSPRPSYAPGGVFCDSPVVSAPGHRPKVRDMVDYPGVMNADNRLGFDYDNVRFPGINI
jgi:tyrosinase